MGNSRYGSLGWGILAAGIAGAGVYVALDALEGEASSDLRNPAVLESLGGYVLRDLRNLVISGASAIIAGVTAYGIQNRNERSEQIR